MSSKKLQTEIDRTLKKVAEGLEEFHDILSKLNIATTQNQKEKYESDLKKEIKKLQRLRDTIKGWQSSSEIKDKQALNEARKLIEVQMEKFKILEKEMKIKAFSKEGLNQTAKLDPKMKDKLDLANWINNTVDKLNTQIDAYEAEVEATNLSAKKGKKLESSKQARCDLLVSNAEKHKNHIQKLEAILRMMENDQVSTERVSSIRDDLDYYLESNLEEDFMENSELYDEFDFSTENESDSDSDFTDDSDNEIVNLRRKSADSQATAKPQPTPSATTSVLPALFSSQPKPFPVSTHNPSLSATNRPTTSKDSENYNAGPISFAKAPSPPTPVQPSPMTKISGPSFASALAAASSSSPANSSLNIYSSVSISKSGSRESASRPFDELMAFLVKKFPSETKDQNILRNIIASYQNLPDNYELERNRQYCPKQPYPMPSYYETEPPPILTNPSIFERFDLDTLFFIFYYQQKTYPQYLAARELKKQSWRFHKKYLTWFQRHEEPKVITNDYEQGTYIYFDYEGSWCQRKKSEFTFEYRYLEDEELV